MRVSSAFKKKHYVFQLETVKLKCPNYFIKFSQQKLDSVSTELFPKSHSSATAYRYISAFRE